MIVVDASVVAEVLLRAPKAAAVEPLLFGGSSGSLHAPALLDIEVLHVLRRFARERQLSSVRGAEAVQDLSDLPIERHAHEHLVARIWELRGALTACDAAYVALAELLQSPLVTLDRRLARSRGHEAEIRYAG